MILLRLPKKSIFFLQGGEIEWRRMVSFWRWGTSRKVFSRGPKIPQIPQKNGFRVFFIYIYINEIPGILGGISGKKIFKPGSDLLLKSLFSKPSTSDYTKRCRPPSSFQLDASQRRPIFLSWENPVLLFFLQKLWNRKQNFKLAPKWLEQKYVKYYGQRLNIFSGERIWSRFKILLPASEFCKKSK